MNELDTVVKILTEYRKDWRDRAASVEPIDEALSTLTRHIEAQNKQGDAEKALDSIRKEFYEMASESEANDLYMVDYDKKFKVISQALTKQREGVDVRYNDDVNKNYEDFWKDIVEKDGEIDKEQIKKELSDFTFLLEQLPKVYMHITGGRMSKIFYPADTVITEADNYMQECIEDALQDERGLIAGCDDE